MIGIEPFILVLIIFGHKQPDTDAVTAAITLTHLKKELGYDAEARILGTINNPSDMYTYYEDFTSCNWWSRWSCWYDKDYQFSESVVSPTYNIRWNSTTIIRFDALCNWWSYLNVGIYGNWEYQLIGNLWYVSSNKNEYKVVVPPGLSSFSFKIEKEDGNTCSIDNVGVYSANYYWWESDSYDLWDWTSMATAFVSWLGNSTLSPTAKWYAAKAKPESISIPIKVAATRKYGFLRWRMVIFIITCCSKSSVSMFSRLQSFLKASRRAGSL